MLRPRGLLRLSLCLSAAHLVACVPVTRDSPYAPHESAALAEAVHQRLLAERESELADLGIEVQRDGTVSLSGRTYTLAMADRAVQIARTTPGVTRVRSDILALPETQR
jgi:hypothetical protein